MGGPHKLLLPWNGTTVMDQVLHAWTQSRVERTVVVLRRDDVRLREICKRWPVEVVMPLSDPADMKASIRCGIEHLDSGADADFSCRWLVAPADVPQLKSSTINAVVAAGDASQSIVVPRFAGRRGHPVSFPCSTRPAVAQIPEDCGLDWLTEHFAIEWLDLPASERPQDIDTPQDYRRLQEAADRETSRLDLGSERS